MLDGSSRGRTETATQKKQRFQGQTSGDVASTTQARVLLIEPKHINLSTERYPSQRKDGKLRPTVPRLLQRLLLAQTHTSYDMQGRPGDIDFQRMIDVSDALMLVCLIVPGATRNIRLTWPETPQQEYLANEAGRPRPYVSVLRSPSEVMPPTWPWLVPFTNTDFAQTHLRACVASSRRSKFSVLLASAFLHLGRLLAMAKIRVR